MKGCPRDYDQAFSFDIPLVQQAMKLLAVLSFAGVGGFCFAHLSIHLFLSASGDLMEQSKVELATSIRKACWQMTVAALLLGYLIRVAVEWRLT